MNTEHIHCQTVSLQAFFWFREKAGQKTFEFELFEQTI